MTGYGVKVFVYGSEYAKGSTTPNNTSGAGVAANGYVSVTPSFTQFSNNPLIIRNKLIKNPQNYIAQPMLSLSTVPIIKQAGLTPRHVDLRPFVLVSPKEIYVTPGGLTRVALKRGSVVVNSSQGGGTKDTWVLEDE